MARERSKGSRKGRKAEGSKAPKKGKGSKEPKSLDKPIKPDPDRFQYLDIAVFLVLVIIASIAVYALMPLFAGDNEIDPQIEMADQATSMNQAFLSSTIPRVVYQDGLGRNTEYLDERVDYLLSQDIYIRSLGTNLNAESLRVGIEEQVGSIGARFLEEDQGYLVKITAGAQVLLIICPGPDFKAVSGIDPNVEVVRDIIGADDDSAHSISTDYTLPNNLDCKITFALFKASGYNVQELTGGEF